MRDQVIRPVLLFVAAALSFALGRTAGAAPSYFPLEEGNLWVYEITVQGTAWEDWTWRVVSLEGSVATVLFGDRTERIRINASDLEIELPDEGFKPWYRFEPGAAWEQRSPFPCDDHSKIIARIEQEPVRTPAGIFYNCIRMERTYRPCLDGGILVDWWAPGVGMVKAHVDSIMGVRVVQLKRYCVEGRSCTERRFRRGDPNADGTIDLADAIFLLSFLFRSGSVPSCEDAADANDDGDLDLSDPLALLAHLFAGTGPLPAPFRKCGVDPTPDTLGCLLFPPCSGLSCEEAVRRIARESSLVGSCTGVVRLRYTDRSPIGWQLICGPYSRVSEQKARRQAASETGLAIGGLLGNPKNDGVYLFYRQPADFGSIAVVSSRSGLTLFGGSIVWDGRGEIVYPPSWRAPRDLGEHCEPLNRRIPLSGYDLRGGRPLSAELAQAALQVVWSTALPRGLATSGYLFEAVVLLYPRSVGAFDPQSAEWIVLLNAGWLE